mgnify:CR=1 FL=1
MKYKALINMSNIHSGGGLQVAISFVAELLKSDITRESERIIAEGYREHGRPYYGTNNIFGEGAATVIKGLNLGK